MIPNTGSHNQRSVNILFEMGLLLMVALFFLALGSDSRAQYFLRLSFSFLLALSFFLIFRKQISFPLSWRSPLLYFLIFVIFEIIRALYGFLMGQFTEPSPGAAFTFEQYLFSPVRWMAYFGILFLCSRFYVTKNRVRYLMIVMSWCGFFIAINTIPPLLQNGIWGYPGPDGNPVFFHPFFYFHEWIPIFLMSRHTHSNWVGDVMALGFFPALGLALYSFQLFKEKVNHEKKIHVKKRHWDLLSFLILRMIFAFVIGIAIFLMFSRGTMVFFIASFLSYLTVLILRFPTRGQLAFIAMIFVLTLGFLIGAGNLHLALKEIRTVEKAFDRDKRTSFSVNLEGSHRAIAIYRDHPVGGVGTGGYAKVSENYASSEARENPRPFYLARRQAMNHYLHVLAEEGSGAFFYFLFLLFYLGNIIRGLFHTKSRFKFIMALSLLAPVLMIFGHANVNHLMQQFSISMLVYISMGASLAILGDEIQ